MTEPIRGRVLIVDDEPDIIEALEGLIRLKLKDVEVLSAHSGLIALEILADERVDCVITDYRMPKMDGLEFLAAAQESLDGARTIMMTAFPDVEIAQSAINRSRVTAFISKPFEPQELVELVGRALWERVRESVTEQYVAQSRRALGVL